MIKFFLATFVGYTSGKVVGILRFNTRRRRNTSVSSQVHPAGGGNRSAVFAGRSTLAPVHHMRVLRKFMPHQHTLSRGAASRITD